MKCNISKIHIIGGSGSGKTYLANILSTKLKIPTYDLDNIFWDNGYHKKKDKELRDMELLNIISEDEWIIQGVYYSWLDDSLKKADLIIILNTNVVLRELRIINRFIKRKLNMVPGKGEDLKSLTRLLKWNYNYKRKNLSKAINKIAIYKEKLVFINNKKELAYWIDLLLKKAELIALLEQQIPEYLDRICFLWDTERFKLVTNIAENGGKLVAPNYVLSKFISSFVSFSSILINWVPLTCKHIPVFIYI
ncbi:hypothetical protein JNUCC74_13945 [Cerasibacillus sp. JNUCC 74]